VVEEEEEGDEVDPEDDPLGGELSPVFFEELSFF